MAFTTESATGFPNAMGEIRDTVQPLLVETLRLNGYTTAAVQAVAWMRFQKSMAPEKPLFVYFALGAVHAPHQVPRG